MSSENNLPPVALTIAGFDPSGGAGVLADARTFAAFGFTAAAVVTSITFQNRKRVSGARHQTGEAVRAQLLPLLDNGVIVCVKTGMLPTREIVTEVARLFRETTLPAPVVDPVMMSSSGHELMEEEAVGALVKELLPLARLLTPNIPEAERLTGMKISSEQQMQIAAAKIRELGAHAVLIKGGHLREAAGGRKQKGTESTRCENLEMQSDTSEAIDVLDDEGRIAVFRAKRNPNVDLHGSGCILSAAIAAGLGNAMNLEDAVNAAKSFLLEEMLQKTRG